MSLRVSPHVYGVGLLEAIEESDIFKKSDKNDLDKDGISGMARMIRNQAGEERVGRFGIRASAPNLTVQSGVAFMHDMGLSNSVGKNALRRLYKNEKDCFKFLTGINKNDDVEISEEILEKVVFYLSSLSPKRRDVNNKESFERKRDIL